MRQDNPDCLRDLLLLRWVIEHILNRTIGIVSFHFLLAWQVIDVNGDASRNLPGTCVGVTKATEMFPRDWKAAKVARSTCPRKMRDINITGGFRHLRQKVVSPIGRWAVISQKHLLSVSLPLFSCIMLVITSLTSLRRGYWLLSCAAIVPYFMLVELCNSHFREEPLLL